MKWGMTWVSGRTEAHLPISSQSNHLGSAASNADCRRAIIEPRGLPVTMPEQQGQHAHFWWNGRVHSKKIWWGTNMMHRRPISSLESLCGYPLPMGKSPNSWKRGAGSPLKPNFPPGNTCCLPRPFPPPFLYACLFLCWDSLHSSAMSPPGLGSNVMVLMRVSQSAVSHLSIP